MAEVQKERSLNLEERLNNFEHWVEENKKVLSIVMGALFVIVGGYFGFTKLYLAPKNIEGNNQMFKAQDYFGKDSIDLALNGDGNYLGFLQILEDYKWTTAANLSHYYVGIIYLKKGQFQDAIDHLESFKKRDKMVASKAYDALGDAYSELGENDKAVDNYKKAAYHFENELTTPYYLKKAGMLLEYQKKNAEAKKMYEEVKSKFPNSTEGREMDKYIGRVEAASNS